MRKYEKCNNLRKISIYITLALAQTTKVPCRKIYLPEYKRDTDSCYQFIARLRKSN